MTVSAPAASRAISLSERCIGCLIGTAVGDSLLLPSEGLHRVRATRRSRRPLAQSLAFGFGLVSDDTEHSFLVAQALAAEAVDADRFAEGLARRLRWWFAALPAGVGLATVRACCRLWMGVGAARSGVSSGGNGAAMRSAILGVRFAEDAEIRRRFVTAAASVTHRHPHALAGALAMAETAAAITRGAIEEEIRRSLTTVSDDPGWLGVAEHLSAWAQTTEPVDDLARRLGCPRAVSGWVLHSVPLAIGGWLRHRHDPLAGLSAILRCGGDTDTVGAMAGALYGIDGGEAVFPRPWVGRIADWPLTTSVLRRAGAAVASGDPPVGWAWPLQPLRNLLFLLIVLAHGCRRLLP